MSFILNIIINSKEMLVIGLIIGIIMKITSSFNIPDSFGFGVMVLLMFNFMTAFIIQGMFGYKG